MVDKKFMVLASILFSMMVLFVNISLGQSKVGTTAVPFLGISVGPRATAMGGAFAAVSDDATSLYYNPGAFSQTRKSQLIIAHTNWLVSTNLNWLGFILNLDEAKVITGNRNPVEILIIING